MFSGIFNSDEDTKVNQMNASADELFWFTWIKLLQLLQARQKKWYGHGRTGRTADYGLVLSGKEASGHHPEITDEMSVRYGKSFLNDCRLGRL